MRVAIFMIKKGLNMKNIFMEFNMMIKRGKIAGKALKNLMFHNHQHHHTIHQFFTSRGCNVGGARAPPYDEPREYEFSCRDTPLYTHYFPKKRKKNHQKNNTHQYYMPPPLPLEECENINLEDVNNVLEIMLRNEEVIGGENENYTPSPLLLGRSSGVRQLRITDSPFPVQIMEDDKHVDQAAEDFIMKFYSQLNKQ